MPHSPDSSHASIRYYVYTLAYPDGCVFYVGKGTGDRINGHEREARAGGQPAKCDVIRRIWADGGEVLKQKVGYFKSDEEASRCERYLIETIPNLTNVRRGGDIFEEAQLLPEDRKFFGASIRHVAENGREYWSARELVEYLGYRAWAPIYRIVRKLERVFIPMGLLGPDDLRHTHMSIELGKGAIRQIEDVELSRLAFLLLVQNADPKKARVAQGKRYIAWTMAAHDAKLAGDKRPYTMPAPDSPIRHMKTVSRQVLRRPDMARNVQRRIEAER